MCMQKGSIALAEEKMQLKIAKNPLDILDNEIIAEKTDLSAKEVEKLR